MNRKLSTEDLMALLTAERNAAVSMSNLDGAKGAIQAAEINLQKCTLEAEISKIKFETVQERLHLIPPYTINDLGEVVADTESTKE